MHGLKGVISEFLFFFVVFFEGRMCSRWCAVRSMAACCCIVPVCEAMSVELQPTKWFW